MDGIRDDLHREEIAFNVDHEAFDLFHAAMLIGRVDGQEVDTNAVDEKINALAEDIARAMEKTTSDRDRVITLLRVFFGTHGFTGDTLEYDAPENSFIHRVIDRKKGLPITLSVLFCEVARRLGVDAYGISFPGHFLVGLHFETENALRDLRVIDPFHSGRLRDAKDLKAHLSRLAGRDVPLTPEHIAPASPRIVLERMLNNLRASYARRGSLESLCRVYSRLLLLRPWHAGLYLERARARRVLLDIKGAVADAKRAREESRGDVREAAEHLLLQMRRETSNVH